MYWFSRACTHIQYVIIINTFVCLEKIEMPHLQWLMESISLRGQCAFHVNDTVTSTHISPRLHTLFPCPRFPSSLLPFHSLLFSFLHLNKSLYLLFFFFIDSVVESINFSLTSVAHAGTPSATQSMPICV